METAKGSSARVFAFDVASNKGQLFVGNVAGSQCRVGWLVRALLLNCSGGETRHVHATAVQYLSPTRRMTIFVWGENSQLHAWTMSSTGTMTYLAQGRETASVNVTKLHGRRATTTRLYRDSLVLNTIWQRECDCHEREATCI
jgi:hypothetical protein